MWDLLRKDVIDETLEDHIAKIFVSDEGDEEFSRGPLTPISSNGSI